MKTYTLDILLCLICRFIKTPAEESFINLKEGCLKTKLNNDLSTLYIDICYSDRIRFLNKDSENFSKTSHKREQITKLRISSHNVKIETDRYTIQITPLCNKNVKSTVLVMLKMDLLYNYPKNTASIGEFFVFHHLFKYKFFVTLC